MEKINSKDYNLQDRELNSEKRKLPRVVKRREKIKKLILEIASKRFSQEDFDTVRLDEIAEEVDISRATLYSFFDSKESLLEEILKPFLEETIIHYEELLKKTDKLPGEKILESVVTIYNDLWKQYEYQMFLFNKVFHSNKFLLKSLVDKLLELHLIIFEKIEKKYLRYPKENATNLFISFIVPALKHITSLPEGEKKLQEMIRNLLFR